MFVVTYSYAIKVNDTSVSPYLPRREIELEMDSPRHVLLATHRERNRSAIEPFSRNVQPNNFDHQKL